VDLPEGLAQAVWDVDHNSLPVPGNVHLAAKPQQASSPKVHPYKTGNDISTSDIVHEETRLLHSIVDVEVLEVALELLVAILQVKEGLRGSNKRIRPPRCPRDKKREGAATKGRTEVSRDWRPAHLSDGVLELGGLEALLLLDLLPRGVHLASLRRRTLPPGVRTARRRSATSARGKITIRGARPAVDPEAGGDGDG